MKNTYGFSYTNLQNLNLHFIHKKKFTFNRFKKFYTFNINKIINFTNNTDLNLQIIKNYNVNTFYNLNLNIKYFFFKNLFHWNIQTSLFDFIKLQILFNYYKTTNFIQLPDNNNSRINWITLNKTLIYRFTNLYINKIKQITSLNNLYINNLNFYYNLNFYNLKLFLTKITKYYDDIKLTKIKNNYLTKKQLYWYNKYNKFKLLKLNMTKLTNNIKQVKFNYRINTAWLKLNKKLKLKKYLTFQYICKDLKNLYKNKTVINNFKYIKNFLNFNKFFKYAKKNFIIMKKISKQFKLILYLLKKNAHLKTTIYKTLDKQSKNIINKSIILSSAKHIKLNYYNKQTTYFLYSYNFKHKIKKIKNYWSYKYAIKHKHFFLLTFILKLIKKSDKNFKKIRYNVGDRIGYLKLLFISKNKKINIYKIKKLNALVNNYIKNTTLIHKITRFKKLQNKIETHVTKYFNRSKFKYEQLYPGKKYKKSIFNIKSNLINTNKNKTYKKLKTRINNKLKKLKFITMLSSFKTTKKLKKKLKWIKYTLKTNWYVHMLKQQTQNYDEITWLKNRLIKPRVRLFKLYTRKLYFCFDSYSRKDLKPYLRYRFNRYKSFRQHSLNVFNLIRCIHDTDNKHLVKKEEEEGDGGWDDLDRSQLPKFVLFTQLHINSKHILTIPKLGTRINTNTFYTWTNNNKFVRYPVLQKLHYYKYKTNIQNELFSFNLWLMSQRNVKRQLKKKIHIKKYLISKYIDIESKPTITDESLIKYNLKSRRTTSSLKQNKKFFKIKKSKKLKIIDKVIESWTFKIKQITWNLRNLYYFKMKHVYHKPVKFRLMEKYFLLNNFNKTFNNFKKHLTIKYSNVSVSNYAKIFKWFNSDINLNYKLDINKLNWYFPKLKKKLTLLPKKNILKNVFFLNKKFYIQTKPSLSQQEDNIVLINSSKKKWFKQKLLEHHFINFFKYTELPATLSKNTDYFDNSIQLILYKFNPKYSYMTQTCIQNLNYNEDTSILTTLGKKLNNNLIYKKLFLTSNIHKTLKHFKKLKYFKNPQIIVKMLFLKYLFKICKFKKKMYHNIKKIKFANYLNINTQILHNMINMLLNCLREQLIFCKSAHKLWHYEFMARTRHKINTKLRQYNIQNYDIKKLKRKHKKKYNWVSRKIFQSIIKKKKKIIKNVTKSKICYNLKFNYNTKTCQQVLYTKKYTRSFITDIINKYVMLKLYKINIKNMINKKLLKINTPKYNKINNIVLNKNFKFMDFNKIRRLSKILNITSLDFINFYNINCKKFKINLNWDKKIITRIHRYLGKSIEYFKNFTKLASKRWTRLSIRKKKIASKVIYNFIRITRRHFRPLGKLWRKRIKKYLIKKKKFKKKLNIKIAYINTRIKKSRHTKNNTINAFNNIKERNSGFYNNKLYKNKKLLKSLSILNINKKHIKSLHDVQLQQERVPYYHKFSYFNKKYTKLNKFNKLLQKITKKNYFKIINQKKFKFKYFGYLKRRELKKVSVWGYNKYTRRDQYTTYIRKVSQFKKTIYKNNLASTLFNFNKFKYLNLTKTILINLINKKYYKFKILPKIYPKTIITYLKNLNTKNYNLNTLNNFKNLINLKTQINEKLFKENLINYKFYSLRVKLPKVIIKSYIDCYYSYLKSDKRVEFRVTKLKTYYKINNNECLFKINKIGTPLVLLNFTKTLILTKTLLTNSINLYSFKLFLNTIFIYPSILMLSNKLYNFTNQYTNVASKLFYFKHKKLWDGWLNFNNNINFHFFNHLVTSFVEFHTSKKTGFLIHFNDYECIPLEYRIILNMWTFRVNRFHYIFNRVIRLKIIMKLFYLVTANQDLHLLMKIITKLTPKIQYRSHRRFFKFIIFIFRAYFVVLFKNFNIKGMQFEFAGKISVTGNARTRKMYYKLGKPSRSTYTYSTKYIYKTIGTYMGVLGVKIWIFY